MDSGWRDESGNRSGDFDYSSGVPTRRFTTPDPLETPEPDNNPFGNLAPDAANTAVRLAIPGAFLVFSGIVNLLVSALFLYAGIVLANSQPDELLSRMRQESPQQAEMIEGQLAQANMPWDRAVSIYQAGFLVAGILGIATGLLGIWGGFAMTCRQNHGLALAGALATAIPCITPMGCLMLGPIFGFWALIVLMREDSWRAFGR